MAVVSGEVDGAPYGFGVFKVMWALAKENSSTSAEVIWLKNMFVGYGLNVVWIGSPKLVREIRRA